MIGRINRAPRRGDAGFTLIELLVVIVVLGLLAGVVVFAVTGTGDKGRQSAKTIDDRTIRTAEESFCGLRGRYGTVQELIDAQLLQLGSKYNTVIVDNTVGSCGNTSYRVFDSSATPVAPAQPTTCSLGPNTGLFTSGNWCSAPATSGDGNGLPNPLSNQLRYVQTITQRGALTQLLDGRILAIKDLKQLTAGGPSFMGAQLFDPAKGPMGTWSPLPVGGADANCTPSATPGCVPHMLSAFPYGGTAGWSVVVKGPSSWCGTRCGNVLFKLFNSDVNHYQLYKPGTSAADGGSWVLPGSGGGAYSRFTYSSGIQLHRTPCGAACGKVLIVGVGTPGVAEEPELYNPVTDKFEKLGLQTGYSEDCVTYPCNGTNSRGYPTLTLLNDGRALMLSGSKAQIFDPVTLKFTNVAGPPFRFFGETGDAVLLSDGRVFATSTDLNVNPMNAAANKAMIYNPTANAWTTTTPSCGVSASPPQATTGAWVCQILAVLADGRVLGSAHSETEYNVSDAQRANVATQLFDPTAAGGVGVWTATPGSVLKPVPDNTSAGFTSPLKTNALSGTGQFNRHYRMSTSLGILIREMTPGSCGNLCNRVLTVGRKNYTNAASHQPPSSGTVPTAVYDPNPTNNVLPSAADIYTP